VSGGTRHEITGIITEVSLIEGVLNRFHSFCKKGKFKDSNVIHFFNFIGCSNESKTRISN
jgi:hypothetical protein